MSTTHGKSSSVTKPPPTSKIAAVRSTVNDSSRATHTPFLPPKIDPEFRQLITPADEGQRQAFREQLKEDGVCYSPLIYWKETGILLDGHTRWSICEELGIEPKVQYLSFPDRDAARNWIIDNQIRRRNLNDNALAYYRGRMFRRRKQATKKHGKTAVEIAEEIATLYGINARTIKRDADYSSNLDSCAAALGDDFRITMLSSDAYLTREQISKLAGHPANEMHEVLAELKDPSKVPEKKGTRKKADPVQTLLKAWQKANPDQRHSFLTVHLLAGEDDGRMLEQLLQHLGLAKEGNALVNPNDGEPVVDTEDAGESTSADQTDTNED